LVSAVLVGLPLVAHAQFTAIVYDPTNFTQNAIQAVQSVITAGEAVTQTAQGVTNLLPLDAIIAADGIAEDMQAIGAVLEDAAGLMQDLQALQALFDVRTAPVTFPALKERMSAMNTAIHQARNYALKTQLLIYTIGRTLTHLTGLVNGIEALAGNRQAQQQIVQVNATISKTLTVLTTQTSSEQRDQTLTRMREEVILASMAKINEARWQGWPGYAGGQ
jgi:hypothetical protein